MSPWNRLLLKLLYESLTIVKRVPKVEKGVEGPKYQGRTMKDWGATSSLLPE